MATNELHAAPRLFTIAACILVSTSTPGCKREQQAPPPPAGSASSAPATGVVAGESASAGVVIVEAGDLPDPSAPPLRVVFGERGAGVAYVAARSDGLHVIHGGKAGRAVPAIDQIAVSPDGKRVAYAAEVEGSWRMLAGGEPGVLATTSVGAPVFSPDSRHLAHDATIGDKKRLVVDGVTGPARFEFIGSPAFSADSALVAFAEQPAEKEPARLVVSDLALARQRVVCSGVVRFVASDAGTTVAAVVEEDGKQRLVLTGLSLKGDVEQGPSYDSISSVAFGPDGIAVAYVAERAGKRLLVLGGKEQPLPHADATDLAYGGGGLHAYAVQAGERWRVVANGSEGPTYDRVVSPSFSPDGKQLVYRARKDGKRFVVVADVKGETIREHPAYEQVFPVRFMPDGRSITYGVKDGARLLWKVEPL